MALNAGTVWEFQTGGNNNNGGGFYDRDTGTSVDYSQQAAAELNLTDLAMAQASTTLTSVTGGFTAAMAGNIIQITEGTNFDVGWYEITAYTDTNTVTLDRTAASGGIGSSGTGYIGGCLALPTDAFLEQVVAGNLIYMKNGTYTLTENIDVSGNDATSANPITFGGYNSSRGDNPTGTNRPTIACGAYQFQIGDYYIEENIIVTTTHTNGINVGRDNVTLNCKFENSSEDLNRYAYFCTGAGNMIIDCELISTNGYAVRASVGFGIHTCYIHDSVYGIQMVNSIMSIECCIFDTCSTYGIDLNTRVENKIINNTFYNCGIAIYGTTGNSNVFLNNIFDSNTTGASWSSEYKSNYWDYNNWKSNGTDVVNVTKGDNAMAYDPQFVDAAGGNFSLGADSDLLGAGFSIRLGVG